MPRNPHPKLKVVPPAPTLSPPAPEGLGPHGLALWRRVTADFEIDDGALVSVLEQAAKAVDLAERCATQIREDGMMLPGRGGPKDHPLVRQEVASRALVARMLARLGCFDTPPKAAGRPGGGRHVGVA